MSNDDLEDWAEYRRTYSELLIDPAPTEYWAQLGQLIETFSVAEALLQYLLWQESGTPSKTARAVFSGVRIQQCMSLINRVREANGKPDDPMLVQMFAQLADINAARNDLVHFGSRFESGKPSHVTNQQIAHIASRVRRFPLSLRTLAQMRVDLVMACIIIQTYLDHEILGEETFQRLHEKFLHFPWLYKHAPQSASPSKSPDSPQE